MNFFIFVAALFFAVAVYELINLFQVLMNGRRTNVIVMPVVDDGVDLPMQRRRTTVEAILLAVLPKRFDPNVADTTDVMALLRRSGYYYANPGEFFAAAIRDFSQYLLVGTGLAVALVILDMPITAIPMLTIYIALGLRRPYTRLKKIARKREEAMKNNMLLGLSVLESLLSVSTSAQQAFTQTAQLGGPFCNLLALLSAQISHLPPEDAVAVVKAHLPNPRDVEANLFLNDVLAYFKESRRILSGVSALRHSVHRLVLDATEERAALVRQRANLFGIFSIVGLLFALILPYMGLSF
jgi:hypothetical protein